MSRLAGTRVDYGRRIDHVLGMEGPGMRSLLIESFLFFILFAGSCFAHAGEKRTVIVITGPGGMAFGSAHGQSLVSAVTHAIKADSVLSFGDGESPVDAETVAAALKATEGSRPLVIVNAHGEMERGKFVLDLGQKVSLHHLFRRNSQPANVFLMSCHGGGCLVPGAFPENSQVVATSSVSAVTTGADAARFVAKLAALPAGSVENKSSDLLSVYLSLALKNRIQPQILIHGKTYDTDLIFKSRVGKPFSTAERHRVLTKLERFLDINEITRVADKIAGARLESDIYAVDYGAALAISVVAAESFHDLQPGLPAQSPGSDPSSCADFFTREYVVNARRGSWPGL